MSHLANHKDISRSGYGKKLYVITGGEVRLAEINSVLSARGVVTGYKMILTDEDKSSCFIEVPKRYTFDDEEVAKKKLFKLKLNNFND